MTVPLDWTLVRGNLRQGRQELSGRLTFRGRGDWRGSRLEVGLSSGTWELWLPSPGPWGLDYVGEGGLWVPEIPVEVVSRGDSQASELDLELAEIRLTGRVVDREGKAVPAAEVELGALEGALAAALATTDTAGRFELILPREGRFQLQARAVGKDGVRFSAPEPVRLESAAVDDEIVLAVEPPERLEVRLEGLPAGSRPEFWWIPRREDGRMAYLRPIETWFSPTGTAVLDLPPRTATVEGVLLVPGIGVSIVRWRAPGSISVELARGGRGTVRIPAVDFGASEIPILGWNGHLVDLVPLIQRVDRNDALSHVGSRGLRFDSVPAGEWTWCPPLPFEEVRTRWFRTGDLPDGPRCQKAELIEGGIVNFSEGSEPQIEGEEESLFAP